MDQSTQRHRGIDAAARDHHVGAFGERPGDREAAEIGVHADDLRRQLRVRVHLADAGGAEFLDTRQDIVAQHDGDLELHTRRLAGFQDGVAAG